MWAGPEEVERQWIARTVALCKMPSEPPQMESWLQSHTDQPEAVMVTLLLEQRLGPQPGGTADGMC